MRYALIRDIHGNLPALEAVLADIDGRAGVGAVYHLAFGHTHRPWSRIVDGIQFVSTGSVGRPKDGDWRAG